MADYLFFRVRPDKWSIIGSMLIAIFAILGVIFKTKRVEKKSD
jgi:drug/metabolite transporter (DMT)-like permease